jgi:hypothetical protein
MLHSTLRAPAEPSHHSGVSRHRRAVRRCPDGSPFPWHRALRPQARKYGAHRHGAGEKTGFRSGETLCSQRQEFYGREDPCVGGHAHFYSMSPEVLLENHPDWRADILSLGVVFYEALSGRHPFQARSFVATSDRILRDSPPPLRRRSPGDISNVVRMGTFLMS